jgi:hypothetical protein
VTIFSDASRGTNATTSCSSPAVSCRQVVDPKPWRTSKRELAAAGPGNADQNSRDFSSRT